MAQAETLRTNGEPEFDFPVRGAEIGTKADRVAQTLIADPALMGQLFSQSDNRLIIAQQKGDSDEQTLTTRFLDQVDKRLKGFDWRQVQVTELPLESSRAILAHLPVNDPLRKRKPTPKERIAESLARGFITERFEDPQMPEWRGAVTFLHTLLTSAVEPQPDLELLTRWFNLVTTQYPTIMSHHSVAGRSFFIARRAAAPSDERFLNKGYDIDSAIRHIGDLFGRREDYRRNSEAYDLQGTQLAAAESIVREGLDPRNGIGRKSYRETIARNAAKSPDAAFPKSMYGKIAQMPLPLEIAEIAMTAVKFPNRWNALKRDLRQGFADMQEGRYVHTPSRFRDEKGKLVFPHNIFYRKSKIRNALSELANPHMIKILQAQLNDEITKVIKEKEWKVKAASFAFGDIRGYLLVDRDKLVSQQEVTQRAMELYEKYSLESDAKDFADSELAAMRVHVPDNVIILVKPEYFEKDAVDSLLDLKIPAEKRPDEPLDLYKKNSTMRNEIPRNYTRTPTLAGDLYLLRDHPDLPDVIDHAVIRRTPQGRLEYVLTLATDPLIFPDGTMPQLSGQLTFLFDRAMFEHNPDNPRLSLENQWIIDGAILELFMKSCCPPIPELMEEIRWFGQGQTDRSTPGYIMHVGGFRSDSTRKQFTPQAEQNYLQAVRQIFRDTGGISLARINEAHREQVPEDDRFVTYNRGYESGVPQDPLPRRNPNSLLP